MVRVENYEWGYYDKNLKKWFQGRANANGYVSVKLTLRNCGSEYVNRTLVYFKAYDNYGSEVPCCAYPEYFEYEEVIASPSKDMALNARSYVSDLLYRNAWHSSNIHKVEIDHIKVKYIDDTSEICNGNYQPSEEEQEMMNDSDFAFLGKGCLIAFIVIAVLIFLIIQFFKNY